ncbi:response regulator transcription factor [Caldicellulosiruptoraceae bacterium PP1]
MKTILVVDDEKHIVELISYNLEREGYKVLKAYSGSDALELLYKEKVDLLVLDIMMSNINGLDVLKKVRTSNKIYNIPVIIVSAKNDEFDKILGIELGADDYLTKPFSIKELVTRIKALFRRIEDFSKNKNIVFFDDIMIDFDNRVVKKQGENLNLSLKEFELLKLLIENKGRVLDRNFILETIWGYEFDGDNRTVDVHIRFLRKKLGNDDNEQKYIETVRGIGYRFNNEVLIK